MRISKHGHHLRIEGEPASFGKRLCRRKITVGEHEAHGYSVKLERTPLLHARNGHWSANAGCLPLLRSLAAREGVEVEVSLHEPAIAELPSPAAIDQLAWPSLAAFVADNERGLIRLARSVKEAEVIADLIRAFPGRRLVVLAGQVGRLNRLQEKLQQLFAGGMDGVDQPTLALVHNRQPLQLDVDDETPQVILATYIGAADVDLATSDIVLLLEARDVAQNRAQQPLEQVDAQFRLFGLIREHRTLSPLEEDSMMDAFGFELIDLQTHGRVRRAAHVEWVTNCEPSNSAADFDGGILRCYIRNHRRNRRTAKLAKELYAHDSQPTVTVLVQHIEHAVALGRSLRDWPIISSESARVYGLPGSVRTRLKNDRRQPPGRRQIVLADVAGTFPGYESDIVIMAAGATSTAALPASWLFQKPGQPRPLRIIDFRDYFDRQAHQWSQQRKRDYAARDLIERGVSTAHTRLQSYIHRNSSRKGRRR